MWYIYPMLPKTIFKKIDRKAASAAWGRYSVMEIKHILTAFMLGILIFEVCILFALEQINFVQFFLATAIVMSVLISHVLTLGRLYRKQFEQALLFLIKANSPVRLKIAIISRTVSPDLPPPRFSS